ncbi:MAG: DUF1667 domain-containing protein [Candidatus Omnitrophota bacterium]|nr:DUF1667 domain-containing protein [Candidatus Omnitrophota bacterium]
MTKVTKKLTCIECPKGCRLAVDVDNGKVVKVAGNECPKGEKYAISEIENPARILTSAVLSQGLALKMIPVRTDNPIPKSRIFEAMAEIKKIRVKKSLKTSDIIVENFMGLGVDLIATRKAK